MIFSENSIWRHILISSFRDDAIVIMLLIFDALIICALCRFVVPITVKSGNEK